VEPVIVAAGSSLALAAATWWWRAREARRRDRLNAALHELRRPLQAIALTTGPPRSPLNGSGMPPIELALAALDDLDRTVNGKPPPSRQPVRLRPLVEESLSRWRAAAALADSRIEIRWGAGSAAVIGDPHRLSQALDNLIVNAIEHGGPPVQVDAHLCARGVRVVVRDSGGVEEVQPLRRGTGHGLRVAAAVAAEHGGRFAIRRDPSGTVAVLELPLAALPLSSATTAPAA
jgi:two-component system, OmpR family, sensor histidine kinase MtrB